MSYFSSALSDALSELEWTQRKLSDTTGLSAPQINRYLRDVDRIPDDGFAKILHALPEHQRARVAMGHLRDRLPPEFVNIVELTPAGDSLRLCEDPPVRRIIPGIDAELDTMLRAYAELAVRHTEVRDMLRSFLIAMGVLPKAIKV